MVQKGYLAACAAAVSVSALKRVDLPTFGSPTIPQRKPILLARHASAGWHPCVASVSLEVLMDPSLRWGDALLVGSEPKRYLPGCHSCNGGLRVPRLTMRAAALSYRPAPAGDPHDRPVRLPDHPPLARAASRPPSAPFAEHAQWREGFDPAGGEDRKIPRLNSSH